MTVFYNQEDSIGDGSAALQPQDSWNFSRLDKLTLAYFMASESTAWVAICLMCVYTVLAYLMLYSFSSRMGEFEFYSSSMFIDRFVANHSLIITGVNTSLSSQQASKEVKKLFDFRFRDQDDKKVVSCNAFRKTDEV